MTPRRGEFETHGLDLQATGNPDANSELKGDESQKAQGSISGERTAGGSLSERSEELSATDYEEDDLNEKKATKE